MNFNTQTLNKMAKESITKIKCGEIEEYLVELEFEQECSPTPYLIEWQENQIDMYGFWSSKSHSFHNLTPNWSMREIDSKTASGMPLACIYNKADENRACIALSDPASPVKISVGVVEENAKLHFKIELLSQKSPIMKGYEVVIRIDRRKIPAYKAIKETRDWWSELGYKCAYVPNESRLPMYSCWYSFHQRTIPEEIIEECKVAKALGMDTVIVDDGWQTDDNGRSYAYCGDWQVCEKKIPDMKAFVDEIHSLGMKFMLWFSVPFVGFESKNYKRFEGKYLNTRHRVSASVLDPRFPDVREFLVDTYCENVKKYGYDGLKLDFIDSFHLSEESSEAYDQMDTVSVEEGLEKLLKEATVRLKEINREIMIEFRQSYIGPIVSRYGNLFRVTDCPNDAYFNRIGSLDLRITSDKIPVHSDMLMWNKDDTNESVMYQLLAIMFSVPQISVRFDSITNDHKRMLKAFLDFWRKHREIILDGEITVWGLDANYTAAKVQKDGHNVAVLYQSGVYTLAGDEDAHLFNSTGNDFVYVESDRERSYEIYNIFGEKYAQGRVCAGVNKLPVKNCEMAFIA